jgi:uncharacterized protein YeaO (DUF488 family)
MIRIRRIYDPPLPADGKRILVDRLWPRGVSKEAARVDEWLREIAPSNDLRTWFGHEPARWEEFRVRYRKELETHGDIVSRLRAEARKGTVTLLFAAKDTERNNAVVLKELLD